MSAQTFVDPYKDPQLNYSDYNYGGQYTDSSTGQVNQPHGANSFGEKLSDFFGFTHYDESYNRYLSDLDRAYERAATNSARAFDVWFDSTKTQRLMNDIKAAGLNPWLAVQNGLSVGSSASTAGSGSSARQQKKTSSKSSSLQTIAMSVIATAKLFAMLA